MKKMKFILSAALLALFISSCSVSAPVLVTDNESDKEGVAEYTVILGIFRPMEADVSIKKAAENGGITKVSTVDQTVESKLFKTTVKTIVTGS